MTDRHTDLTEELDEAFDDAYVRPSEPWDPPAGPARQRRVTHLVLVDGLPADHWVDESGDASWSHHPTTGAGRAAQAEPPAVRELRWLDALVGGRTTLLRLGADPLDRPDSVLLPAALAAQTDRVDAIRRQAVEQAGAVFHDPEMRAAAHHTLQAIVRTDQAFLARSDRDDTAVGAVIWIAGHANGHLGPTGDVLARDLWQRIGVPSSAASRGGTTLHRLRSSVPGSAALSWVDGLAPLGAPRLKPTGHADLLTSQTRALLIARRDAALAAVAS
jgi:hypothetical protein